MSYDYEQTHEKIMQSAFELFKEKGFSKASIREICKEAGVTNGAFYAHFDSKEDLFNRLVKPVIDGMQELYDEENRVYMKIYSVNDINKVMKQTFSSNNMLIHYLYEHKEVFKLLISAGSGTAYENFTAELAEEEAANTMKFIEKCRPYLNNDEKISYGLIKQISNLVVSSVFDGLIADKTEDEVRHETELASEFCLAGIKHMMGI